MTRVSALIAVIMLLFICGSAVSAGWTVVNLHPAGAMSSAALGVSGGQQTGYADFGGGAHACLWTGTAGSFVDLHPAGAEYSEAWGVSDGWQVGYADFGSHGHAGIWNGTSESWVDLHPAGADYSYASGFSDGQQVGLAWFDEGGHASLWSGTPGSWVDLHPAGAYGSAAAGLSDGQQVGCAWFDEGGQHACLWSGTPESWVDLHPAGAYGSAAAGLSDGQQVGFAHFYDDGDHACLWSGTPESWVDLHPAGAQESEAYSVSDGQQVGHADCGDGDHAGLWSGTAESWIDLHDLLPAGEYSDSQAWDIDVSGGEAWIVGDAKNALTGRKEAMLWHYVPEAEAQTTVDVTRVAMDYGNGFNFDDPMDLDVPGNPCGGDGVLIDSSYFHADPPLPPGSSMQASYYFGSESYLQDPVLESGKLILTSAQLEEGDTREARFIPTLIADSISWPARTSDIELRAVFDNFDGDLAPPSGEGVVNVYLGFDVNHDYLWWDELDIQCGFLTFSFPDGFSEIPAGDYHQEPYLAISVDGGSDNEFSVRLAPEYDPAYPVELKVVISMEKLARFYAHFGAPEEEWVLVAERQVDWWPDADTLAVGCGSGMSADVRYAPRIGSRMWYDSGGSGEPIEILTEELPDAEAGVLYDQTLVAVGGSGGYEWQIVRGGLPVGLYLENSTGRISGYPWSYDWTIGCRHFTVQVRDLDSGETAEREFVLVVGPNMVQEIAGVWGFHSISVIKSPGNARANHGSISFDPSGTATVNRVQPDGSVVTSAFAYTVHPDGSIDSDGRHWGNLSFDHKRIVATSWDETEGMLTICGRGDSGCEISQFDMEGSWSVHSFEVGPSWQGWREIEGEIDEWGRFSGTRTASDGSSGPYLADVLVAEGTLNIHEVGNQLASQHSFMSPDYLTIGSVMGDAATPGTGRFDVGIRNGGDFLTEDLEGTWHYHGVSTWGTIGRGSMEVAADGTFIGDFFDSDSEGTIPISGWLDISADGSMSMAFDDGDGQFEGEGTLSMDRAYFVFTEHEEDGATLIVAVKEGKTVESQVDVTHVYMNWGNGFVMDDPLDSDTPGTPCGVEGVTVPSACLTHPALEEGGTASALHAFETYGDHYPPSYEPGRITLKSVAAPFGDESDSEAVPQLALENTPWVPQTQDMELRATFENLQGYLATPAGYGATGPGMGFTLYDGNGYLAETGIYLGVFTGYLHRGYPSLSRGYYNRALVGGFGCWVDDGDSDAEYLTFLDGYDLSQPVELKLTISPSGLSRAYLRFTPSEEWVFLGEGQSSLWPGAEGWASGCYWPDSPSGIRIKPFVKHEMSHMAFGACLSVSPETIPNAVVGIPYEQKFCDDEGWGSRAWSIANGTLPAGLTLSADGVLSGTPTEAGTFHFAVRVEDSRVPPAVGEREYMMYVLAPVTIEQAKGVADGAQIALIDIIVTRKTADGFYVEEPDRSAGMFVQNTIGEFAAENWVVGIEGWVFTTDDGEKALSAQMIRKTSDGTVRPIGTALRNLGGSDFPTRDPYDPHYDILPCQRGVEGGSGLNNIGLLVKTWGRVTQIDPAKQYFYVEDGSAIMDGTQTGQVDNQGVRIAAHPLDLQPGDYVTVTGVSSCFKTPDDELHRVIRAADMQVHFPSRPLFVEAHPQVVPSGCRIGFSSILGASGYRLYESSDGTTYNPTADVPEMYNDDYGFFHKTPAANTHYKIVALDSEGTEGRMSADVFARVTDPRPHITGVYPSCGSQGISRSPSICVPYVQGCVRLGVMIEQAATGNTVWGVTTDPLNGGCMRYGDRGTFLSYALPDALLEPNTDYWFEVYAFDAGNWELGTSWGCTFTTGDGVSGGGGGSDAGPPPPPPF